MAFTDAPHDETTIASARAMRLWSLAALLFAALALSGCGSDEGGGGSSSCEAGTKDCLCATGAACGPGLSCVSGTCKAGEQGALGMACFANMTCNPDEEGRAMLCVAGTCQKASCTQGSDGCGCLAGASCAAGLVCDTSTGAALCQKAACAENVGTLGCACDADYACKTGPGGAGLACDGKLCISAVCTPGTAGCFCGEKATCAGGLVCDATTFRCGSATCTPGESGCACKGDGGCNGDSLSCKSGVCTVDNCAAGEIGCTCKGDGTCAVGGASLLVCQSGKCLPKPACAEGSAGCACTGTGGCIDAGFTCDKASNTCKAVSCAAGVLNCGCKADGGCDAGLVCANGQICVDNKGFPGGACLTGSLCNAGAKCTDGSCATCALGSEGCACMTGGGCYAPLTCHLGSRVAPGNSSTTVPASLNPPKDAQCWTPCNQGITKADGSYTACGADGLLAGCVDDQLCQKGSCVKKGTETPKCATDLDCAEHQTCYLSDGHCYSNCDVDMDCGDGASCYRHVCRDTCSTKAGCDKGQFCKTIDGENGFCMPLAPPTKCEGSGCGQKAVLGSFQLEEDQLSLSGAVAIGETVVHVDSAAETKFTVRKVRHSMVGQNGPEVTCVAGSNNCPCQPGDGKVVLAGITYFCDTTKTTPLHWLKLGASDTPLAKTQEVTVSVPAGKTSFKLKVSAEGTAPAPAWQGVIEVSHPDYGVAEVTMAYAVRPDGRWIGTAYFFATFEDEGLDKWQANPQDFNLVKNAFVQQWQVFRNQPQSNYEMINAMMTSVIDETWQWEKVRKDCKSFGDNAACIPYAPQQPGSIGATNGLYKVSSDVRTIRMPSGVTELPISFNLKSTADPTLLTGRITTADSLQYGGNPEIKGIKLKQDPAKACSGGLCVIGVSDMNIEMAIGGRYATESNDTLCDDMPSGAFGHVAIPWLVPGFLVGTEPDVKTNQVYRYECRSKKAPYGDDPAQAVANMISAASNPIADGKPRSRTLSLLDGALINQTTMVLLFRETMPSFLGSQDPPTAAYGFMLMSRTKESMEPEQFKGSTSSTGPVKEIDTLDKVGCSKELLETVLGPGAKLTADNATVIARAAVNGTAPIGKASELKDTSPQKVHYLCVDTGYFNSGGKDYPNADKDFPNANKLKFECPVGSQVTYFTLTGSLGQSDCPTNWNGQGDTSACIAEFVARQPCQNDGTCFQTFQEWKIKGPAGGKLGLLVDPPWKCKDENKNWCDYDRENLRSEKLFYVLKDVKPSKLFTPLTAEIDQAFRYKTRFRNRFGKNIGFTPTICVPNSDAVPYCYDPKSIENIRERVDCVAEIYTTYPGKLDTNTRDQVHAYLVQNYGFKQEMNPVDGTIENKEGFEKLYAELLVMLGDDSYVKAFGSRFDLAGTQSMVFEGALFEEGGITLSGTAGVEMVELYRAIQYYQLGLDRFFRNAKLMSASLNPNNSNGQLPFLGQQTVEAYFKRLTRASIQKTRAWNAIAQRYVAFNKQSLARAVVERAYTAAYLESVILGRMMLKLLASSKPEERAQILSTIEKGQIAYRSAMLEMRDVYKGIQDTKTIFGLQPDYIPFPALDANDGNAFQKALSVASDKIKVAAEKEEKALSTKKTYDTDEAAFQNELISIRNNYENQLADICGTFQGVDGKIYPATAKYAYLHPQGAALGNLCGMVKTGTLSLAVSELDVSSIELKLAREGYEKSIAAIKNERQRVQKQCNLTWEQSNFYFELAKKEWNLNTVIQEAQDYIDFANEGYQIARDFASALDITVGLSTNAPGKALQFAAIQGAKIAKDVTSLKSKVDIKLKEQELQELELQKTKNEFAKGCQTMQIESEAKIHDILMGLKAGELEIAKVSIRLDQSLNEVMSLRNQARRLMAEQEEAEQQTINIEAAKNDPNTRVYKNDDVLTADRTFLSAVKEAYKATRVFEYYTSQSYAKLEDLFLVRMVNHGDTSLEKYLAELSDAYLEFEELYGKPDQRVAILSLRDDLLNVPRISPDGKTYSDAERIALMRERLSDTKLLNDQGYLTINFATDLTVLSPLTRNHKIDYIEAELVGSEVGDTLGRVYLVQRGTSTVRAVTGANQFYTLPERTAVLNTFFNGKKVFPEVVYQSRKHKDRPYANGDWKLMINQKDELVNQDINLQSVVDLRVYVYYTDFTSL